MLFWEHHYDDAREVNRDKPEKQGIVLCRKTVCYRENFLSVIWTKASINRQESSRMLLSQSSENLNLIKRKQTFVSDCYIPRSQHRNEVVHYTQQKELNAGQSLVGVEAKSLIVLKTTREKT